MGDSWIWVAGATLAPFSERKRVSGLLHLGQGNLTMRGSTGMFSKALQKGQGAIGGGGGLSVSSVLRASGDLSSRTTSERGIMPANSSSGRGISGSIRGGGRGAVINVGGRCDGAPFCSGSSCGGISSRLSSADAVSPSFSGSVFAGSISAVSSGGSIIFFEGSKIGEWQTVHGAVCPACSSLKKINSPHCRHLTIN